MPVPFANSEELGEAWHSISGYGKQLHDPTRVETLLRGGILSFSSACSSPTIGSSSGQLGSCSSRKPRGWRHPGRLPTTTAFQRQHGPMRWSFFTSAACWHGGAALAVQELAVEEVVSSSRVGLVRARVEGVVAQTICPKCLWKCGWNM